MNISRFSPSLAAGIILLWCAVLAFLLPDGVGAWKYVCVGLSIVIAAAAFLYFFLSRRRDKRKATAESERKRLEQPLR